MARASNGVSDECSGLAFYGIRPGARAAEAFYDAMVAWFRRLGHPPDKLGVSAPGFSRHFESFRREDARLRRSGFRRVGGIELVATTPRAEIWGRDYYVTASYMTGPDELTAYLVARSSLATLSAASLLPVAREVAAILKPVYGFGYTRSHELHPAEYAIGLNVDRGPLTGGAAREQERIVAWGETLSEGQVYRQGILRDVYRWNFLTRPHLRKKVGRVPLGRWIRQEARRGTLGEFGGGMHFWEVAKRHLPAVRRALRRAGLIFEPEPEDEEDPGVRYTPEESLAFMLRHFGVSPDDVVVFDGTGREVPTEEVKKVVRRGRRK
jgi:hypothetical protein